ncbi:hypothetical protein BGZ65_006264 [Modicella reniformis]|uniref:FCP1 homology domain-containing protein n=1 Tax=Modicella reniformis TaxID=1440133 RepID=A0A9P6IMQ1_9FUNG|nr:hypothetical protein BGZ65_006264 [Modicella reniformis]
MTTQLGLELDSVGMVLDSPVKTRSSRSSSSATTTTITVTEPLSPINPVPKVLGVSGPSQTSMTEESTRLAATGTERRSKISARGLSQTREKTRTRNSRPRARSRTIPTKVLKVPGDDEEKSDEDDDDEEEEVRFRYHLRSPAYHRRLRSIQKSPAPDTTMEEPTISDLTLTPRLTRLGTRHESGHDFEDEPEMEQPHQRNRQLEKVEKSQSQGRRSRSTTSSSSQDSPASKNKAVEATYSSPGAQAAPRKVKKKSMGHHTVPSLPVSRRRLRARATKVAKMGIDSEGGVGDEDDEDEDDEEDDDDEEEEDEDVDFDNYHKKDGDTAMMEVEPPSSGLQPRQSGTEELNILSSYDTLNGFIASKPEASITSGSGSGGGGGLTSNLGAQVAHHAKRKVEDEYMEDAPAISTDEGQLVSTKLARIDDASDGDKNPYLKTFYNILKTPRSDDDDGILSSESDDAELESEDDEDDFEEIDVYVNTVRIKGKRRSGAGWEFIATLPPLGPLPQNFVFTMPERASTTPPITLVLDIDETLVHCATRPLDSPDIIFPVEYNQETWKVFGRIRPGMQEFLEKMSTMFEVITFTASQECYAEALLKIIDPDKKYIRHRYYRDSCVPVFGNYVKDLRILNRDLSKVIIIDNSPQAFGYQISNGIPIESWYDDKSDRELYKVMSFLETIGSVDDVRPRIDEHYKLQEKIQKALAQAAAQQQLSSVNGLGALGTGLSSSSGSTSNTAPVLMPLMSSAATSVPSTMTMVGTTTTMSTTMTTVGTTTTTMTDTTMNLCHSTGTSDLVDFQNLIPGTDGMDTAMILYGDLEKPLLPSDEDDEREEDEDKNVNGRRLRSKTTGTSSSSGGGSSSTKGVAATHGMTMTTRSTGLDTSSLAQISL